MLFSGLPDSAFDDHLAPVDHFIFPAGSTLFREGDSDAAVFSIRRGIAKLLSMTSDGHQRIVRLLGPGMAIGLELLEPGSHYQHTAVAVSELDACRIPVSTIDELELQFPELCTQIRQRLQDQLNSADDWIVELGTGTARKRIAHLMLMMMEFATEPGGEIPQLSGTDIAAIIGASPETVSRIIADMKGDLVLILSGDHLYRMDYRNMLRDHLATKADITLAALPCSGDEIAAKRMAVVGIESILQGDNSMVIQSKLEAFVHASERDTGDG